MLLAQAAAEVVQSTGFSVTAVWLQLVLQAGAFGLLVMIFWKAPGIFKEVRESRMVETKLMLEERRVMHDQSLQERKDERDARHALAGEFHRSILAAMAANVQMREEDRRGFEERNKLIVQTLERQTDATIAQLKQQTEVLAKKMDSTHKEVQRLVVKAEHVTVIPPKSD